MQCNIIAFEAKVNSRKPLKFYFTVPEKTTGDDFG